MLRQLTHRAGITALVFAALLLVQAPPALAKKSNTETVALVPPDHAGETAASGKVKIVQKKNGDRMIVRVKRLDRRTLYNVLDRNTGALLGTIRTNKRGKGRLVLTEGRTSRRGKVAGVDELPDEIEITQDGDEECVLETEGDPPLVGDAEYTGDAGHHAFITLISIPAPPETDRVDLECFILSLTPPAEGDEKFASSSYELMLDSVSGDEMPLGVAHAADLAERAFEIRDGDGKVWIVGKLPAVAALALDGRDGQPEPWPLPPIDGVPDFDNWPDFVDFPDFGGFPTFDGAPDRGDGPRLLGPPDRAEVDVVIDDEWQDCLHFPEPVESDVTLWIADDDGVLTKTNNLLFFEWPTFDWPVGDWPVGDWPMEDREREGDNVPAGTR